jgi:hypothetical protein
MVGRRLSVVECELQRRVASTVEEEGSQQQVVCPVAITRALHKTSFIVGAARDGGEPPAELAQLRGICVELLVAGELAVTGPDDNPPRRFIVRQTDDRDSRLIHWAL